MNQSSKDAIIWYTKVLIDVSDRMAAAAFDVDWKVIDEGVDEIRDIVYKIREEFRDEKD